MATYTREQFVALYKEYELPDPPTSPVVLLFDTTVIRQTTIVRPVFKGSVVVPTGPPLSNDNGSKPCWFYSNKGAIHGPTTVSDLSDLLGAKKVDPADSTWSEGSTLAWSAGTVSALYTKLTTPLPAPPISAVPPPDALTQANQGNKMTKYNNNEANSKQQYNEHPKAGDKLQHMGGGRKGEKEKMSPPTLDKPIIVETAINMTKTSPWTRPGPTLSTTTPTATSQPPTSDPTVTTPTTPPQPASPPAPAPAPAPAPTKPVEAPVERSKPPVEDVVKSSGTSSTAVPETTSAVEKSKPPPASPVKETKPQPAPNTFVKPAGNPWAKKTDAPPAVKGIARSVSNEQFPEIGTEAKAPAPVTAPAPVQSVVQKGAWGNSEHKGGNDQKGQDGRGGSNSARGGRGGRGKGGYLSQDLLNFKLPDPRSQKE